MSTHTKEPMSEFSNQLSAAESERLALLVEECGEVIQAASKVLRHGYESKNPLRGEMPPRNRENLAEELGHVLHVIDRMSLAGDVDRRQVNVSKLEKSERIGRWLHHQAPNSVDVGQRR